MMFYDIFCDILMVMFYDVFYDVYIVYMWCSMLYFCDFYVLLANMHVRHTHVSKIYFKCNRNINWIVDIL
jgi:hypothetical protein